MAAVVVVLAGLLRPSAADALALAGAQPNPTFAEPFEPTATPADTVTPAPTATPSETPTPLPTATYTPAPPTAAPAYAAPGPFVELTGLAHAWQTWNNCGPATLATNLSFYGSTLDQAAIGSELRRHEDDKNVGPEELAAYARSQGYHAQVRVNGTAELLRTLVANNVPVLVETWLEPEPNDGLGHYRLVTGYDDAGGYWIAYDSYYDTGLLPTDGPYRGIAIPYAELERDWAVFNRTYVLVYPETHAVTVEAILGAELEESAMWQAALQRTLAETQARPDDAFAWFNVGTNWMALGDAAQAAAAFDRAQQLGLPWRMHWYQFGPFEAYFAMGRYGETVALAESTLASTGNNSIEELHYWRGRGLAALGDPAGACTAQRAALALNPDFQPAAQEAAVCG